MVVYKHCRQEQDCTRTTYFVFNKKPCQFKMNGLAGVSALVWVTIALAVLINEAAALGGGVGAGRMVPVEK
ncbi:hypothetical protein MRX96_016679 [Rhipicephalus microplus]